MEPVIRDDRAKQGRTGKPVLWVLLGSLALLAVALVGLMSWIGSTSPEHPSQNASRESVTGSTSGSTSNNPTDRTPAANPAYPLPDSSTTGSTNAPAR
jgi:flagellar basal body-associated protein FliL